MDTAQKHEALEQGQVDWPKATTQAKGYLGYPDPSSEQARST
ncbi:hypothetical protein [Paludibacterium denitrificans]|nr:hypothetical protein [Paludibacterium denitrificans]